MGFLIESHLKCEEDDGDVFLIISPGFRVKRGKLIICHIYWKKNQAEESNGKTTSKTGINIFLRINAEWKLTHVLEKIRAGLQS